MDDFCPGRANILLNGIEGSLAELASRGDGFNIPVPPGKARTVAAEMSKSIF